MRAHILCFYDLIQKIDIITTDIKVHSFETITENVKEILRTGVRTNQRSLLVLRSLLKQRLFPLKEKEERKGQG